MFLFECGDSLEKKAREEIKTSAEAPSFNVYGEETNTVAEVFILLVTKFSLFPKTSTRPWSPDVNLCFCKEHEMKSQ